MANTAAPIPRRIPEIQDAATIEQLAMAGVATTLGRSVAVRGIGLAVNIVLARFLAPDDFGELALGLTIYTAIGVFANAGLGASLVRRADPPDPDDLSTVFGAQLVLGIVSVAVVVGLAVTLELRSLILAALFLSALPIQAPRTAALILLERRLDYKRMGIINVIDSLSQAVLAITLVLVGLGPYGVALASGIGVVVGTTVLLRWRVAPVPRPRLERTRARTLLKDGALFGASDATNLMRDLALNWGTAAIAGLSVLGTWSLATRLALIPGLVVQALGQVSYSAVPRLHAAGGSAQGVVVPMLRLTTVGLGAPVTVLAGSSPIFVPLILGSEWDDISDVLPLMCLGLVVAGPVSVASAGYLFAVGRVRRILVAQIAHSAVAVGLAFALLPHLGITALGVAMVGVAVTDGAVLGTASLAGAEVGYMRSLGPLLGATVGIGGASLAWAGSLVPSWPSLFLVVAGTFGAYCVALLLLARADAHRLWRLLASMVCRPTLGA